jgi:alpha-glucosidase (family GH31 glycosyl hydrolase)
VDDTHYLTTASGQVRLRWLAENVLHVTHAAPGGGYPPDRPWMEAVLLKPPLPLPPAARLEAGVHAGLVQAARQAGSEELVFAEAFPPQQGLQRTTPFLSVDIPKVQVQAGFHRVRQGVRLGLRIFPGERFYGWGEWFDAFPRRGGRLELRIRDAISLLQSHATYSAIPIFLSSRGYAFWLLNSYPSRWKLDRRRGVLEIEAGGPGADYLVIYGPEFETILGSYTALTGRPPLPPRWAFGLWVTSYPQGSQETVLGHVQEHRQRGIPLDAAVLDYHWEEGFHNFRWRGALFPDPQAMLNSLKELGVRLGLILTPFLNRRGRGFQRWLLNSLAHNLPPGAENDEALALPEYEQARSLGLLAHEEARWWFGAGGMLDFANPAASKWWNERLRPLYEQGVAFFKNDDGEYLPEDARSAAGMDGSEYHNLYGFYYGRALYDGMQALDERRGLVFSRSVWAGSQRYPGLFLGDQKPTFECLQRTLRAGLNLSLLGFDWWGADVFGLDGKTTPETHMRHAQWTLLNPIARYFWRPAHIDGTRFPWSHSLQAEDSFRRHALLRYRLLPYFSQLAWQAWLRGLPALRPLALAFPDDPSVVDIFDQAMLGEALMQCPVVVAGALERQVYLPAGSWHDFWSTRSWQGPGTVAMPAGLDHLPLLARGGSILPLGAELQHISDEQRFEALELLCWPPYPARLDFYDDDGRTRSYQRGEFSITRFSVQPVSGGLNLQISAAEGSYPGQPGVRQVAWLLQRCARLARLTVDGLESSDWTYDPQTQTLRVPMQCSAARLARAEIIFAEQDD